MTQMITSSEMRSFPIRTRLFVAAMKRIGYIITEQWMNEAGHQIYILQLDDNKIGLIEL